MSAGWMDAAEDLSLLAGGNYFRGFSYDASLFE